PRFGARFHRHRGRADRNPHPLPAAARRRLAKAAADVGVRVTLAVFLRDRNPLVYSLDESVMAELPAQSRATIEAQFFAPMPGVEDQIARVEAIAGATESDSFSVQRTPARTSTSGAASLRSPKR